MNAQLSQQPASQAKSSGPLRQFNLGQVVATPGAINLMDQCNVQAHLLLNRHLQGDWGECCAEDAQSNQEAINDGSRIMSVYRLCPDAEADTRVWIITEAEDDEGYREATTILLPSEY